MVEVSLRLLSHFVKKTLLKLECVITFACYELISMLSTTRLLGVSKAVLKEKACGKPYFRIIGFEVFTAVTMKNAVFMDVAPCGSCKNRRFGGTCRIHLQGRKEREKIVRRLLVVR
jgi:hypothetical protein